MQAQKHKKLYNDLLNEKCKSENALRQQAEEQKSTLEKDWSRKLSNAVNSVRLKE